MAESKFRAVFTIAAVDKASAKIAAFVNKTVAGFQKLEKTVGNVSKKMRDVGAATAAAGAVMLASLAMPVQAAMTFEEAMVGLGKQAGVTRDAMGQMTADGKRRYSELTGQVFKLARTIPMVHEDLAGMMEAGARMGVAEDKLEGFTRTAAMMASAFDAAPAELAEQMAKISNVMDVPIDKLQGLADVINYLDDQAVAKGADIINVLQRVGGAAKFVNMTGKQVSALATTFLSMGTAPEVAATGINAMIMKLAAATKGSKAFQAGLGKIGLSADSIQKGMFSDAEGTILRVLNAIKSLPQTRQIEVLSDLFGNEYADDVAKLAGGLDKYKNIRDIANSTKAAGSMQAEFNARLTQTSNKLQLMKNRVVEVGIKLGTLFLPTIGRVLDAVTPLVDKFSAWVDQNPELAKKIGLAVAAIGGFLLVAGTFLAVLGAVGGAIAAGIGYVAQFAGAFGWLVAKGAAVISWAQRFYIAFQAAFTILTAAGVISTAAIWGIVAAVAALGIGAFLLWKNWDKVGPFFARLWESVKLKFLSFVAWLVQSGVRFFNAGKNVSGMIADGILRGIDKVKQAIGKVTAEARKYLPFSPAKEGAFKDLHRVKIVETIAQAVRPAPLKTAMAAVTAAAITTASPAAAAAPGGLRPLTGGAGGGDTFVASFHIHTGAGGAGAAGEVLRDLKAQEAEFVAWLESAFKRARRGRFQGG